jgi:uncharacterized membrane protein
MKMMEFLKLYALTVPVFFLVDMLWLGIVARNFYRNQLGALLRPEVNWPVAILFYLVFIAGILFFAVLPARESNAFGRAVLLGALFGFFTYATYDLTNLATLKNWPGIVTIVDIIWGSALCASV